MFLYSCGPVWMISDFFLSCPICGTEEVLLKAFIKFKPGQTLADTFATVDHNILADETGWDFLAQGYTMWHLEKGGRFFLCSIWSQTCNVFSL